MKGKMVFPAGFIWHSRGSLLLVPRSVLGVGASRREKADPPPGLWLLILF